MRPVASVAGRVVVRILLLTYVAIRLFWFLSALGGRTTEYVSVEAGLKLALWFLLAAVTAWLLVPRAPAAPIEELGLSAGFVRGLTFGALATIPMMFAVGLLDRKSLHQDLVAGSAIIGPLAEEILFRGFLFRQLVRRAGWPVWAALVLSSIAFGLAHIRNVDAALLMAWRYGFLTTYLQSSVPYMAAGALFAWVTYRWNSLWPAIALHGLMNFWWDLTKGEHAQPAFHLDTMSVAQGLSVMLAIALTLRWTRREA